MNANYIWYTDSSNHLFYIPSSRVDDISKKNLENDFEVKITKDGRSIYLLKNNPLPDHVKPSFDKIREIELKDLPNFTVNSVAIDEDSLFKRIDELQHSEFSDRLKYTVVKNDIKQFRFFLVEHFLSLALEHKKNNNFVAYYCCKEMASKIENVPEQETYAAFIRLSNHLRLFKQHNHLLHNILKMVREYNNPDKSENEIKKLILELQKLHKSSIELLENYQAVSTEVDDIFAYYRGEFTVNYRNIDYAISKLIPARNALFIELPLKPGSVVHMPLVKAVAQNKGLQPSNFDLVDISKKVATLCRVVMELDQVAEITSGEELAKALNPDQRNSVMLVTCSFGTGHKMTARAIKEIIGTSAHVTIIDPTIDKDLIVERDWIYKLGLHLGKNWSSPLLFNWILEEQHYWMINVQRGLDKGIRSVAGIEGRISITPSAPGIETGFKRLLRYRLLMERPNLITTTYHMDLNPLLEVSEELGLPLLHVPTDMDVKMSEVFDERKPGFELFRSVLPDSNEETLSSALTNLSLDQVHIQYNGQNVSVTGVILRPEFYIQRSQAEIEQIKKERGIDPEATVIAVMSGGGGQDLPYANMLLDSKDNGKKYHMIVVAGANTAAGKALNSRKKPGAKFITGSNPNVTVEVLEDPVAATDNNPYYVSGGAIARLHAISDVGITKPGGVSIAEFLQTGVPMIPDRRVEPMVWEEFNIRVLQSQNRGRSYTGKENFLDLIDEVKAMGKKPMPNRAAMITQQMGEMIVLSEDRTDVSLSQRRTYIRQGINL